MYASAAVYFLAASGIAQAFRLPDASVLTRDLHIPSFSNIKRSISETLSPRASCPAVWSTISSNLTDLFLTSGQCNNLARQAIRAAFHDCFNNGCDGSLILAGEFSRPEDAGMADICSELTKIQAEHDVGMADLIQFAGAHAIRTCPLGPAVPAYVGRNDNSTAAPAGQLPPVNGSGDSLLAMFKKKEFTATDLAALIGAHSTSTQSFVDQSKAGESQDSTPGIWDVAYYGQTLTGTAPFTFESDKNLAAQEEVKPVFQSFVANQKGWDDAFVPA